MKTAALTALTASAALFTSTVSGALLFEETVFGTDGTDLGNQNGWQAEFNNTGPSTADVVTNNINSVSPYPYVPNALQVTTSTATAAKQLAGGANLNDKTTFFSYHGRSFNNAGTGVVRFRSDAGNIMHAGYSGGFFEVMAHTTPVQGAAHSTFTNYFFVGRISASANGRDITIEGSMYDDVNNIPTSEPVSFQVSDSFTYGADKNWTWVTVSSASANTVFDGIRVATTYAEVVNIPEPATMGLLAVGGALAARRRR